MMLLVFLCMIYNGNRSRNGKAKLTENLKIENTVKHCLFAVCEEEDGMEELHDGRRPPQVRG